MSTTLSRLSPPEGSRHSEKRVGRGIGSGLGKTAGRGSKGQKARSGGNINKVHFQGGQTPMQRRLPKRGFRVPFPVHVVAINVAELDRFDAGSEVTLDSLRVARLLKGKGESKVKILGDGELTKKLTVQAHLFSKSAREKIERAGGTIVELAFGPAVAVAADAEAR